MAFFRTSEPVVTTPIGFDALPSTRGVSGRKATIPSLEHQCHHESHSSRNRITHFRVYVHFGQYRPGTGTRSGPRPAPGRKVLLGNGNQRTPIRPAKPERPFATRRRSPDAAARCRRATGLRADRQREKLLDATAFRARDRHREQAVVGAERVAVGGDPQVSLPVEGEVVRARDRADAILRIAAEVGVGGRRIAANQQQTPGKPVRGRVRRGPLPAPARGRSCCRCAGSPRPSPACRRRRSRPHRTCHRRPAGSTGPHRRTRGRPGVSRCRRPRRDCRR